MKALANKDMICISGGSNNITASVINAIAKLVDTLFDIGRALGSSIRRSSNNGICPLN